MLRCKYVWDDCWDEDSILCFVWRFSREEINTIKNVHTLFTAVLNWKICFLLLPSSLPLHSHHYLQNLLWRTKKTLILVTGILVKLSRPPHSHSLSHRPTQLSPSHLLHPLNLFLASSSSVLHKLVLFSQLSLLTTVENCCFVYVYYAIMYIQANNIQANQFYRSNSHNMNQRQPIRLSICCKELQWYTTDATTTTCSCATYDMNHYIHYLH